ncbi:MAG: chalcone isomerase family protein [Thermoanaerobaculia bacterium]|nr:chalcone isomerase family protein [Thermoanaerobaculia bacterium]
MIRKFSPIALSLLLAVGLLAPGPVAAGELAGVTLPDSAKVGTETLKLNGMALRSKAIFKVYVAGLYLPASEKSWGAVLDADTARRLDMHWVRSVGKDKICEGWTDGLAANTPSAGAKLVADFETLCGWMADARAGDLFTFSYQPGVGTAVEVKGTAKGTIEGKAFADALFACWIGEHPGPGEDFRTALMGGE